MILRIRLKTLVSTPTDGPRPGRAVRLAAALAAGLGASLAAADAAPTLPTLNVAAERGLLSVDVRQAPLADVLRRIGERAGFVVTIRGDLSRPVTQGFSGVLLEEGLRRLTRGESLALVYASRGPGGPPQLTELLVYATPPQLARPRAGDASRPAKFQRISALARQRDAAAVAELAGFLAGDPDPLVRSRAADTLGRMQGAAAASALTRARADEAASVRIRVLMALRRLEGPAAVVLLRDALLADPDPGVRRAAAWVLGALRNETARSALESALGDRDESVRRSVTAALRNWAAGPR